jgi:hypothetical protein
MQRLSETSVLDNIRCDQATEEAAVRTYVGVPLMAFLAATFLALSPTATHAVSACTGWMDFTGTLDSCLEMVDNRTRDAGFKGRRVGETFFFWFGANVVTARCIPEKDLVAFAAYHRDADPAACRLSDRIKNVLKR